jgi:hypothetical protein
MEILDATRKTYIHTSLNDEIIEVTPWTNDIGYDINVMHGRTQQTLSITKEEWKIIENIMKKANE